MDDIYKNKDNLLALTDKIKDLSANISQWSNLSISLWVKKILASSYETVKYIIWLIFYFSLMKKFEWEKAEKIIIETIV